MTTLKPPDIKGIVIHGLNVHPKSVIGFYHAAVDDRQIYYRSFKPGDDYLNLALCLHELGADNFTLAWGNAVYATAVLCQKFGIKIGRIKGIWEKGGKPPFWVDRYDTMDNFRSDVAAVLWDFRLTGANLDKRKRNLTKNYEFNQLQLGAY